MLKPKHLHFRSTVNNGNELVFLLKVSDTDCLTVYQSEGMREKLFFVVLFAYSFLHSASLRGEVGKI